MITKTYVGAYYDLGEWHELPLYSEQDKLINDVKNYSKRRSYVCGVFESPYQIGSMIYDNPLMLFLHGVRYNKEQVEMTELETIIENQKAGI